MTTIHLETEIHAPIKQVFDLSRSIDLHLESTAKTNEKAIDGVTTGLIGMGETVTWRARHFGVYQNFTSKITQFELPNSFIDEMMKGAFKSFKHLHLFKEVDGKTKMTDEIQFEAPFGLLGLLVERLVLKSYLTKFILKRNVLIKSVAERKLHSYNMEKHSAGSKQ